MRFIYKSISTNKILPITVLLFISFATQAQTGNLTGFIKTKEGKPAAEVYIQIKETKKVTVTKEDGSYLLTHIPQGTYHIIVSFVGLHTIQKSVSILNNKTSAIDFTLVENETELTEIIVSTNRSVNEKPVTVGKLPIKPMDLPQAVVTVSEATIKNQQAQRLSDVIKNVNGVYLGTTRASTQESFYARGYSFSSTNMFKNGSRVNSGAMPEVSSLESVEVLKGSAAILYGNVAPGGILNMITKKPKFVFGGEVSLRAGSYNLIKPVIDIYGPLNNKIAYRINGTIESADSYRNQVSSKRYYINPSLLFKIGNRSELIVEGDFLKHEFTPDFGTGTLNDSAKGIRPASIAAVPRSRFMGTNWQYNTTIQTTASATFNHSFYQNWKLNSVLSFQQYKRDYFSVERIQALYYPQPGTWARPLGRVDTKEKYFTGQVNLNGQFKTGKVEHILLAGADADHYITNTASGSTPHSSGFPNAH